MDENLLLGEFSVGDNPRALSGEQRVDIRFTYDLNGVLEVDATVVDTGCKVRRLDHARAVAQT